MDIMFKVVGDYFKLIYSHEINEEIFAPEFKIEKLEGEIMGEKR